MIGVINHWDILAHPVVTIRCFGWGVFFRAIGPWQSRPFLSLLRDAGYFGTAVSKVPTILQRCVGLELRAKRIYKVLAEAFADEGWWGRSLRAWSSRNNTTPICWNSVGLPRFAAGGRPTFSTPGTTTCLDLSNKWTRPKPPYRKSIRSRRPAVGRADGIFGDQPGFLCRSGGHGFRLRQEAEAVSRSDGSPHGVPCGAAAGIVSQHAAGLPGIAGEVPRRAATALNSGRSLESSGFAARVHPPDEAGNEKPLAG